MAHRCGQLTGKDLTRQSGSAVCNLPTPQVLFGQCHSSVFHHQRPHRPVQGYKTMVWDSQKKEN